MVSGWSENYPKSRIPADVAFDVEEIMERIQQRSSPQEQEATRHEKPKTA
jgi:hypothetical protein